MSPATAGRLYNLWKDARNPTRCMWRRTTLEYFRTRSPGWATLLDVDRLATDEDTDWLLNWTSLASAIDPRAIVALSRGGSDAVMLREFDLDTKASSPTA